MAPPVSPALQKKTTRQNSASFTLLDIQKLIAESEARVIAHVNDRFDALASKIDSLEAAVTAVKAVQAQQETDIARIKELIVSQQSQIEASEERERRCNIIISGLPETDFTFEEDKLEDDHQKIETLVNAILPPSERLDVDDIKEVTRLGRGGRSPRIVRVRLTDVGCRNRILRSCGGLNADSIRRSFGRIYVNKDMSLLRRQEEKRLRLHYKELKAKYPDETKLRNGKLYLGLSVKDAVDFRNQLF